jgi:hypothetical protein
MGLLKIFNFLVLSARHETISFKKGKENTKKLVLQHISKKKYSCPKFMFHLKTLTCIISKLKNKRAHLTKVK